MQGCCTGRCCVCWCIDVRGVGPPRMVGTGAGRQGSVAAKGLPRSGGASSLPVVDVPALDEVLLSVLLMVSALLLVTVLLVEPSLLVEPLLLVVPSLLVPVVLSTSLVALAVCALLLGVVVEVVPVLEEAEEAALSVVLPARTQRGLGVSAGRCAE